MAPVMTTLFTNFTTIFRRSADFTFGLYRYLMMTHVTPYTLLLSDIFIDDLLYDLLHPSG